MTSQPNVGVPQHEALPDFLLDEPQPGAVHEAHRNGVDDTERLTTMLHNVGRNLASLVGLFFVSLVAFIVCTTLFSVGAGLAIIVVGLFVLVACLLVAGTFAQVTKQLLAYAGVDLPATHYARLRPGFGALRRLQDPQSWRDLLHVLISFVITTFSFSVAVSWVFGGLGGLTYWFWSRYLPGDNEGLAELLGLGGYWADVALNTVLGTVLLLTTPAVLHGLVRLNAVIARALLVDERSALRARVSELTESRSAAGVAEAHTLRRLERDLHDGRSSAWSGWAWTSPARSGGWTPSRSVRANCSTRPTGNPRTP